MLTEQDCGRPHQLAEIGATEAGGVARVALTDADRAGRDQFVEWVTELECSVHIDRIGNLFARREAQTQTVTRSL